MNKTIVVCVENDEKARDYVDALEAVRVDGEEIEVVTAATPRNDLIQLGGRAAGLLLCGGPDLEPWRFGEEPRPDADLSLLPELDAVEWDLLEGAQAGRTPVWAVCRGLQTLNVFLGGTLWQDLPTQVPAADNHYVSEPLDHLAHEVRVDDPRCELGELLAGDTPRVNTRHHQAIREIASGLRSVASSPDGVLEVIEGRNRDWWLRGVQWHPENLMAIPLQRKLWRDFVETAVG